MPLSFIPISWPYSHYNLPSTAWDLQSLDHSLSSWLRFLTLTRINSLMRYPHQDYATSSLFLLHSNWGLLLGYITVLQDYALIAQLSFECWSVISVYLLLCSFSHSSHAFTIYTLISYSSKACCWAGFFFFLFVLITRCSTLLLTDSV